MKKGPLAEAQVVRFLQEHGWPLVERRLMGGSNDRGDVAGIPGLVIEVKNQASMTLAAWLDEAKREAIPLSVVALVGENGRDTGRTRFEQIFNDLPVVWHKRRGKGSPGDWYVTMDGWAFLELLAGWEKS